MKYDLENEDWGQKKGLRLKPEYLFIKKNLNM